MPSHRIWSLIKHRGKWSSVWGNYSCPNLPSHASHNTLVNVRADLNLVMRELTFFCFLDNNNIAL